MILGVSSRPEPLAIIARVPFETAGPACRKEGIVDFDPRDYEDTREDELWGYDRDRDDHDRDRDDPRDPFVDGLDLPRGLERELVRDDRENLYELNGEDSRMLATIGAFRVISEHDLGVEMPMPATLWNTCAMTRSSFVRTWRSRTAYAIRAPRSNASFWKSTSSASTNSFSRNTIGIVRTATVDRIGTSVRLRNGHANTICRISTSACIFPDFRIEYELDGRDRHEDASLG